MASRSCVHVNEYADADGGPTGDYIPSVTVDLRIYYPPLRGNIGIALEALDDAYRAASKRLFGIWHEEGLTSE